MEKKFESKIHYLGVFWPMRGHFGYPLVPSTLKFLKKIFGKYTSRFSLSDSMIKNMCINMLDGEKKIMKWLIQLKFEYWLLIG